MSTYNLGLPHRGASDEYLQLRFLWRNKQNSHLDQRLSALILLLAELSHFIKLFWFFVEDSGGLVRETS